MQSAVKLCNNAALAAQMLGVCEAMNLGEALGVDPKLNYSGGERGWIGDNPFIYLDTQKINQMGWKPKLGIQEAILKTIKFLRLNEWVFEERK